jgi:hypothetical protein
MSYIKTILVKAFQVVTGDWVRSAELYYFFGSNRRRAGTASVRPGQFAVPGNAADVQKHGENGTCPIRGQTHERGDKRVFLSHQELTRPSWRTVPVKLKVSE